MKKKSLITMLVALTLVAVVGVGATLAYLSSTTGTLTNTFTVGKVSITQDEIDIDKITPDNENPRTTDGNDYTDIQPGDTLKKDPTVTVLANSSDCYVFMKLSGADALVNSFVVQDEDGNDVNAFSFDGFNDNWVKVSGDEDSVLDGVYRYTSVVTKSEENNTVLPALFTSVKYSIYATELPSNVTLDAVKIVSCAVQSDNMTEQTALDAALAEME